MDFADDHPSVSVLVLKELTGASTQGEHYSDEICACFGLG